MSIFDYFFHSPNSINGTTIFEYFQNPIIWFNTKDYTVLQIVLFTTGAVLWVAAYINTIYRIRKKQTLDIPAIAITLNFGCEVVTGIFFLPNMGFALVIAYWAWMVLDAYIIFSLFKYGYKQMRVNFFKQNVHKLLAIGLLASFLVQCSFIVKYDLPMAPLDSYVINLVMSVCFIYMFFIPGYEGNSKLTGWAKFLGTGIISVMFQTKYPDNYFLTSLYIFCALFDVFYLYLLYKVNPPQA
jgi:hypothetical protein